VSAVALGFGRLGRLRRQGLLDAIHRKRWGISSQCRRQRDGADRRCNVQFPGRLAIDPVENKLYVSTSYDLLRCNLDGSGLETVISGGSAFDFYDLEIDVSNRKIYWSD